MKYFVFGSNKSGIHGKGAALEATKNWGAIRGHGEGKQGKGTKGSSYAIPTRAFKQGKLYDLDLQEIQRAIIQFEYFAMKCYNDVFLVTALGTGLAGNSVEDIAPLFTQSRRQHNVFFPKSFIKIHRKLDKDRYWSFDDDNNINPEISE